MSPDPSHIVTEFIEALDELEPDTYLDDVERFGELEPRVDPQTGGWEER